MDRRKMIPPWGTANSAWSCSPAPASSQRTSPVRTKPPGAFTRRRRTVPQEEHQG